MAAFDFMQIKWFIRIARLLLVAFCVIIGLAVASSLEGSPWLCGGIGGLFARTSNPADADGNVDLVIDARMVLDFYVALCEADGHPNPPVIGA